MPRSPFPISSETPLQQQKLYWAGKGGGWRGRFSKSKVVVVLLAITTIWTIAVYTQLGFSTSRLLGVSDATGASEIPEGTLTKSWPIRQESSNSRNRSSVSSTELWRYPLIDRAVLDKLDKIQNFFENDYYRLRISNPSVDPVVTGIQERPTSALASTAQMKLAREAICESAKYPRPCRFLLPLRISEQESKARMHFSQIAELAARLNRTLVLPNVGKSKIGACFKWSFGTYYDSQSLADNSGNLDRFVALDDFRGWLHGQDLYGRVSSQLVSVASSLPTAMKFRDEKLYARGEVVVHAYEGYEAWKTGLPGCFSTKFQQLELETFPAFISIKPSTNKDISGMSTGNSIMDAFSTISPFSGPEDTDSPFGGVSSADPRVLVINWDLRYPVFPTGPSLQYSERLQELAYLYAPAGPYLVVQWRMETVDSKVLDNCAHALVDLLVRLLYDETLATNISAVWFASDYPYPIARRTKLQPRPALVAKSGTFKNFEIRHEKAIDVLRNAFDGQSELARWKLTDLADAMEIHGKDAELIHDAGVLGIVDKMISMNAQLFVSGSNHCSRKRCVHPSSSRYIQ